MHDVSFVTDVDNYDDDDDDDDDDGDDNDEQGRWGDFRLTYDPYDPLIISWLDAWLPGSSLGSIPIHQAILMLLPA